MQQIVAPHPDQAPPASLSPCRARSLVRSMLPWLGPVLGILGAALAFRGVQIMQSTGPAPLLAGMPTGILSDVFGNPWWVLAGTFCCVLGALLAALGLPEPESPVTVVAAGQPERGFVRVAQRYRRSAAIGSCVVAIPLYAYALLQAPGHASGPGVVLALGITRCCSAWDAYGWLSPPALVRSR